MAVNATGISARVRGTSHVTRTSFTNLLPTIGGRQVSLIAALTAGLLLGLLPPVLSDWTAGRDAAPAGNVARPAAALDGPAEIMLAAAAVLGLAASGGLGLASHLGRRRRRAADIAATHAAWRVETSLAGGRCGLWDMDVARGRILWSRSLHALLGHDRPSEFLSFAEVAALLHPADGDLFSLAKAVAAGETTEIDHDVRVRSASGDWVWMRARAGVVIDPQDGGRHLLGTAMDISDERSAAERTVTADMRLRDAVEAVSEAFVLWDADNRLVLCNSKFRKLHELPADKARPGTTYADLMRHGTAPVVAYQLMRDSPDETGGRTLEARLADGRWLHISERRTKDGGFVSVGTDITALKRQEERLLESEGRLIATVHDLRRSRQELEIQTQTLADLAEGYHEQTDRAEAASRAKTEFLAKVSHELRTPLNAIIGFADVLRREMFGPLGSSRYVEYCGHVHTSGLHLLRIISDILQMSQIEAGEVSLQPEPVDLRALVDGVAGALAREAEAKTVAVSLQVPPSGVVRADRRALEQILSHLLENAIKFTPEGGRVDIRARPVSGGVNIFVADNGIGIPAAFLPRLGQPFEQVETEFNRGAKGSGLGLAIARALAEMHGGVLRLRSEDGVGTIAMIHLPASGAVPAYARAA